MRQPKAGRLAMSRTNSIFLAMTAALVLGGCTIVGAYDVKAVRNATPQGGTPFTAALLDEYRTAAIYEAEKEYEWDDAGIFARKGLSAARGTVVLPEEISAWKIPA